MPSPLAGEGGRRPDEGGVECFPVGEYRTNTETKRQVRPHPPPSPAVESNLFTASRSAGEGAVLCKLGAE